MVLYPVELRVDGPHGRGRTRIFIHYLSPRSKRGGIRADVLVSYSLHSLRFRSLCIVSYTDLEDRVGLEPT